MLFGSAVRLGQLSVGHLPTANGETQTIWKAEQLAGLADFIEYEGNAGFIGHRYFLTDATVRQDMVALIRDSSQGG